MTTMGFGEKKKSNTRKQNKNPSVWYYSAATLNDYLKLMDAVFI